MDEILRIRLLGSPRMLLDTEPLTGFATLKAQALLFYLAVTGQPHSRDQLATLLWEGMTETQAKKICVPCCPICAVYWASIC